MVDAKSRSKDRVCLSSLGWSEAVISGGNLRDWTDTLFETQNLRREHAQLCAKFEERKEVLESVRQRKDEVLKETARMKELHMSYDEFLQGKDVEQTVGKAEKEKKEVLLKEAELQRLKGEYKQLKERECELLHQEEKDSVYQEFMERAVKFTKCEDLQGLTGHLESLLLIRDQLSQKDNEAQEQLDQQRKALLRLEDQHHLMKLQKNNQQSKLQTELESACTEARIWAREWNHIQETAAQKTLLLGQIKMATLNLYEVIGGHVDRDDDVDVNDTDTQLEKIHIFIQDNQAIVKQHQSASQQHSEGLRRDEAKRHRTTHNKR